MADTTLLEVFGLDTFEMGDVGVDGAMGAVLTAYSAIKDDTMTFELAVPEKNEVNIYQSDSPYHVILSGTTKQITLEVLGLKLSEVPDFLGGAFVAGVGGTKDTWSAPVTIPNIIQSVKIDSEDKNGQPVAFNFPRCRVSGGLVPTISKTDGFGVSVVVDVLTPFDGSGDPLASLFVEGDTVT